MFPSTAGAQVAIRIMRLLGLELASMAAIQPITSSLQSKSNERCAAVRGRFTRYGAMRYAISNASREIRSFSHIFYDGHPLRRGGTAVTCRGNVHSSPEFRSYDKRKSQGPPWLSFARSFRLKLPFAIAAVCFPVTIRSLSLIVCLQQAVWPAQVRSPVYHSADLA